jgi:cell shape-determining protein MreC
MRVLGRRRSTVLVLLILCAVLSVRPIPMVNSVLDLLFTPTRFIAELVAPLSWVRASEVQAAELSIDKVARTVRGSAARLLSEEQRSALPTLPGLRTGRRRVHGEVIRRTLGNKDRIEVRVATTEGIVPDLPVVTGNHYIGRVARLDGEDPNLIHVDLVTGKGFFVGAAVQRLDWRGESMGQPVPFVAGGLVNAQDADAEQLHLALHHPILRGQDKGRVFVSESGEFDEVLAALSHGFLLGELQSYREGPDSVGLRIQSPLDFKSGLFQVIVLTAETAGEEARMLELDTFVSGNWLAARALTRGDVTPTREGRRLSKGSMAGISTGRAVALGAHLVGRVGEVSSLSCDLLGLGDPGIRLAVLAKIDGESVPRPMGEIVSLGRSREDGSLAFRWTCRIDLEPAMSGELLYAELYTGSGEDGVPRGLFIGWAALPTERATHEIKVMQDSAVQELNHVFVWTGAERARGRRGAGTR